MIVKSDNVFKELANSVGELNSNIKDGFDGITSIFKFFGKVGDIFKEAINLLSNPIELLHALQPWIITLMIGMIILHLIGFKSEKCFKFCFLILIISILF